MKRPTPSDTEAERFRGLVQQFVRGFGLLVATQTPCGHPISVSHAHALMVLLERRDPCCAVAQSELGRALGIDKSNVARLCARMEAAGHIRQRRSAEDGRSRLLELTRKGTTLATQIQKASRSRFGDILGRVSPAHRTSLCEALIQLNAAVAALGNPKDET
jgi:DNA-binding MarR family transcriptional regulator